MIEAVVIGASAGGVAALAALLPRLRGGTALSVLVVLHLPRERDSLLPALYAPHCALAVREAQDNEPVLPGHLYFAPPDYHLLVEPRGPSREAWLALSMDAPEHHARPSIDVLFDSAADCWGLRLAGVLLTGANADGAAGLVRIGACGGVTVVQDPATAEMPAMPAAGLRACGRVDHQLPLAGIGDLLHRWSAEAVAPR